MKESYSKCGYQKENLMLSGKKKSNGFTLIELLIAIAIVGILASIAIPNFIAYRNKSFCTRTEADARSIAVAVLDYFAIASHTKTPDFNDLNNGAGIKLSGDNNTTNSILVGVDPNINITIQVTDMSGRCPQGYQAPIPNWNNYVYTKLIQK